MLKIAEVGGGVEVAECCRSKGIYVQELEVRKKVCFEGQETATLRENLHALKESLGKERSSTKELERELSRKEKALTETAAILTL